jgi:hypothetical protein
MASPTHAGRIIETHSRFADDTFILYGSAAVHLLLGEAGVDTTRFACPKDADTLCSEGAQLELIRGLPEQTGLVSAQVTWQTEQRRKLGFEGWAVNLVPDQSIHPGLLRFSAIVNGGSEQTFRLRYGDWHDSGQLVTARGVLCIPMYTILESMVFTGRRKDLRRVKPYAEAALEAELVSDVQYSTIIQERNVASAMLKVHPKRYYARVEGSEL